MKVTVTLGSNRPGGLDMSLHGLARQTYQDFEVIFVDGRYKQRHGAVLDAVARSGLQQPFLHVPNHRSSGNGWSNPCAGYNTGFALADGDLIVMLLDYAWMRSDWLAAHVAAQSVRARLVMAPYEYHDPVPHLIRSKAGQPIEWFDHQRTGMTFDKALAQHEIFDEISCFKEPFTPDILAHFPPASCQDTKMTMQTGPAGHEFMHTKNESFPRQAAFAVGGMAEFYDRGRGPGDLEFSIRLMRYGLQGWIETAARIMCINPRPFLPNPNGSIPENQRLPPPHDHRIHYREGEAHYFTTLKGHRQHSANPISLEELRDRLWSWRHLSQRTDPVLSSLIVSDQDYFT